MEVIRPIFGELNKLYAVFLNVYLLVFVERANSFFETLFAHPQLVFDSVRI